MNFNNNPKNIQGIPNIICRDHDIRCKYFCVSNICKHQKKIACSECMFEGIHQNHQYQHFNDIYDRIQKVTTTDLTKDKLNLESHIKNQFQKIQDNIVQELEKYQQYFLDQIAPLNLAKIQRLTVEKLTGNNVTQEDIRLILNIENEIKQTYVPLFVKNQLNEYLTRLQDDVDDFLENSLQPFALKKEQLHDFKNFFGIRKYTIRNVHNNYINDIDILSKNSVITASSDKTLKVYDMIEKKLLMTLQSDSAVNHVLKLDDRIVVSGHRNGTLKFWNWPAQTKIADFKAHNADISGLIQIDNQQIASSSWDQIIKIWDIQKGECLRELIGHVDRINCLDKYDDNHLISGGNDYMINIWDIENPQKVDQLKGGHSKGITTIVCLNDEKIASGDEKGLVIIWSMRTRQIVFKIQEHTDKVMKLMHINTTSFASCSQDGVILIIDPKDASILHRLTNGHSSFISNMVLSYENHLISVGYDKRIVIWQ